MSPAEDMETINTELILADLQTLDKALPRLEKEARMHKDRASVVAAAQEAREILDSGRTLFAAGVDPEPLRELFLLTNKPFLYVINCDEEELTDEAFRAEMTQLVAPAEAVFLDAQVEAELTELPESEALELLQSIGQSESGIQALARVGFQTLGLQTYLTAGPKEARAWTIPTGATAPEAAGVIHTDFQQQVFIKAQAHLIRRAHGGGLDAGGEGARQGPDRGQGLRDGRRRRGRVPLQRVNLPGRVFGRPRGVDNVSMVQAPINHTTIDPTRGERITT